MVIVKNNNQKFILFVKTELFFGLMAFGCLFFVPESIAYEESSAKYHVIVYNQTYDRYL